MSKVLSGKFSFNNATGYKITSGKAYHWTTNGCSAKIDLSGLPNGATSIEVPFITTSSTPDHWVFYLTLDNGDTFCSAPLRDRCTYHNNNTNVGLQLAVIYEDDVYVSNTYSINMSNDVHSRFTTANYNSTDCGYDTNRTCDGTDVDKYNSEVEQLLLSHIKAEDTSTYCEILPGLTDILHGVESIIDDFIPSSARPGVDLAFTALIGAMKLPCD